MKYANTILSLTKAAPTEPFVLRFQYLDERTLQSRSLPDGHVFLAGMPHGQATIETVEAGFAALLHQLLLSIDSYPYTWPLEGQKLDVTGFDLYEGESGLTLSPAALATAKAALGFREDQQLETPYSRPVYVTAPHLTKLSLTLQKASPLSQLSFQLHATQPVRLAALVYESDLAGYAQPIQVNLSDLQVTQSAENITILFGKPILAKRLTFTLAQDAAEANVALGKTQSEDWLQPLTDGDFDYVARLLGQTEGARR